METLTTAEGALSSGGDQPPLQRRRPVRRVRLDRPPRSGLDTNGKHDIFLRDRKNGTTEKVSTASNGDQSDGDSQSPDVSDNGRYITFQSMATDLTPAVDAPAVPGRLPPGPHPRHHRAGHPQRRRPAGQPGRRRPQVSADGTKVAFDSIGHQPGRRRHQQRERRLRPGPRRRHHHPRQHPDRRRAAQRLELRPDDQPRRVRPPPSPPCRPRATTRTPTARSTSTCATATRSGPFADTTGLIQQNAKDFNGAPLTIAQLVALNDKVLYGVAGSESTIDDFAHGTFDDHRGPIMRLYWAFFLRMPDLNGLNFWTAKEAGPMTLRQVANGVRQELRVQDQVRRRSATRRSSRSSTKRSWSATPTPPAWPTGSTSWARASPAAR